MESRNVQRKLQYSDLKNCPAFLRMSEDYSERIERLRSLAEKTTPTISKVGGVDTSQNDRLASIIAEIGDLESKYSETIEKYRDHINIVEQAIDELQNGTHRRILRLRYIDGLPWEEIKKKIYFSKRHCMRIHDKALYMLGIEDVTQCHLEP